MSKHITCATAVLHDPKTAAAEIDKLLSGKKANHQIRILTYRYHSNATEFATSVSTPFWSIKETL
jgi:TPP-dependent 2-oxoacid decarboxylase